MTVLICFIYSVAPGEQPRYCFRDAGPTSDGHPDAAVPCPCRWGDSPLRFVQTMLFLNYTAEAQLLDFVDYSHDKVML